MSTIAYVQAGGFGTRLAPLIHQPGMKSMNILSKDGRNLLPFNHNGFYAVAKPVINIMGTALSRPLIESAVRAGCTDIRMTLHNMPETVLGYYQGRNLGSDVSVGKFLYEGVPLDTSGGIVRDVMAGLLSGTIKPSDTILVLGGDIRTDANIEKFLAEHDSAHADISILLAMVPREEMHRFGGAVRDGDNTPGIGPVGIKTPKGVMNYPVFGELNLNPAIMARITRFTEKAPRFELKNIASNPGNLDIAKIFELYGPGALSATNLQNGSIYAIRAELIAQLAPLIFNLSPQDSALSWAECNDINSGGPAKFSDFGGDWFMALTGRKDFPNVTPFSRNAELKQRIIEDLKNGMPQLFGYRFEGIWSDYGTIPALLQGHFEILDELVTKGRKASWPLNWHELKTGYPPGVIAMHNFDQSRVNVIPPVFIGRDVTLLDGATIGPYAIIGQGWEVGGTVENTVLSRMTRIDRQIAQHRGWRRFVVPADMTISRSIVGSGFELSAIDHEGKKIDTTNIVGKVVVSNGSENVISPIDI